MFKKFYDRLILSSLIFGILIGTIVFVSIFGVSILNPKNIDWYVKLSGDSGQHILGWLAYLKSDYFFPIGLTDYLIYPNKYSIIYTDSIPLFSFILKPLYYLIGDFQYFGIYGLFNIIMQVAISIIIIRKFTNNIIVHIFGSLLVVFSPILFFRIFAHHSLSSHWIILVVIAYILYNYKIFNLKRDIIFFSVISFLVSGIHFYFFPMIFGLCVIYILYKVIETKKIILLIVPAISFLVTLLALYVYGAFYGIESSMGGGLGLFSFNLNGFINSFGYSTILKEIPSISGQYEGFAYLGMGCLILVIISFGVFFYKKTKVIKNKDNKIFWWFVVISFIFFIIVSTGGYFSFGKKELFYIELPQIFATFRASGRFIWISIYILLFTLLYLFSNYVNKKYHFILIIIFIIQLYDLSDYILMKGNSIKKSVEAKSISKYNQEECKFFKDNFKYVHIDIGPYSYNKFYNDIYKFLGCNIPINNFYFARAPYELMKEKNTKILSQLYNKSLDNNTLVLINSNNMSFMTKYAYKMGGGNVFLLSNKEINFLEKVEKNYYKVGEKINYTKDDIFIYGWYSSEKDRRWSIGNESVIIIPVLNSGMDIELSLELTPYLNEKLKEQHIKFMVGNNVVYKTKMDNRGKNYQFKVPKEYIIDNIIKLKIQLQNPVSSPLEVGIRDARKLGVSFRELTIEYSK